MLERTNVKRPCITVGCGGYVRGTDMRHPATGHMEHHPLTREKCFNCQPRAKVTVKSHSKPLSLKLCTFKSLHPHTERVTLDKMGAHRHTKNKT